MTQGDFDHLRRLWTKLRTAHEEDFLARVQPDKILAYFEGLPQEKGADGRLQRISINNLFPSNAVALASLYPDDPSFDATPKISQPSQDQEFSAKILASSLNYFFRELEGGKHNRRAITHARMFGYGVMKQGWRFTTRTVGQTNGNRPEPTFGEKVKGFFTGKKANVEQGTLEEFVDTDEPFLFSISPNDIWLDHRKPFGDGSVIVHHIKRTLQELKESNLYDLDDDFFGTVRTGLDDREIELDVYEMWLMQKDGVWVFTYCERYAKPLRWQRVADLSEGLPFQLLAFTDEPEVTYPMPHMGVAFKAQTELDYVLSLWLQQVDRNRSQLMVQEQAVTQSGLKALERNEYGGIVLTKTPPAAGIAFPLTNAPVSGDIVNTAGLLRQHVQEILGVTGARQAGRSELKTATQEKIADTGNELRESKDQQAVKNFLLAQGKKMAQHLKQYATGRAILKVTGLNVRNPLTGKLITEQWMDFGTPGNPDTLRDSIQGDYDLSLSIKSTASRSLPVERQQLMMFAQLLAQVESKLQGEKIDAKQLILDIGRTFEAIDNPEKYFIPVQELPAQTQPLVGQPGQLPAPGSIPNLEGLTRSAENIPGLPPESMGAMV